MLCSSWGKGVGLHYKLGHKHSPWIGQWCFVGPFLTLCLEAVNLFWKERGRKSMRDHQQYTVSIYLTALCNGSTLAVFACFGQASVVETQVLCSLPGQWNKLTVAIHGNPQGPGTEQKKNRETQRVDVCLFSRVSTLETHTHTSKACHTVHVCSSPAVWTETLLGSINQLQSYLAGCPISIPKQSGSVWWITLSLILRLGLFTNRWGVKKFNLNNRIYVNQLCQV